ncbi:MAG TPA: tRNA(Ile)-lysidine synthetase, partial [Planctomycetia bacterium]|nr:tRNA(Ile)-lysidine synthetase [Planctomycetia bacterium]
DRFRPLGVDGEKKLKDFFIDTKTPRWERNNVLLVATDAHPVWVVGLRIDERVKITPDTRRVLKLSVR